MRTGVDAEFGAVIDQEAHLAVLVGHIEAAGCGGGHVYLWPCAGGGPSFSPVFEMAMVAAQVGGEGCTPTCRTSSFIRALISLIRTHSRREGWA
jgi:hypothetical protein